MKKTLIILYLLFPYMLFAQSNMEVRNETIYSEAFAQERSFRIAMPKNMQSDTKYNLLFVLDADYVFDVAAATAIYMQTFDYIPPTAVVAVDYAVPGRRAEIGFSPETMKLNASGEKFYRYLNDELLPTIYRKIPSSGFNTLVGHSHTATYLLYHLAKCNEAFSAYVLFTPEQAGALSIGLRENDGTGPLVRIVLAEKDINDRRLFGESLCDTLQAKKYDTVSQTVAADHMSVIPVGMSAALSALYDEYWNIDRIAESEILDHQSVWECFMQVGQCNEARYGQPRHITGAHIACFLGTAIERKDIQSAERLVKAYKRALDIVNPDANALGVLGDLLRRMGRYEDADHYFRLCIEAYDRSNRSHETWYWRQTYALSVLPVLHRCDYAWEVLDEGKRIFSDDSAAFDYYQGLLSVNNDYRLADGLNALEKALESPSVLSDNFISPEDAKAVLNKAIDKTKFLQE